MQHLLARLLNHRYLAPWCIAITLLGGVICWAMYPPALVRDWMNEGGWVEETTPVSYLLAFAILWLQRTPMLLRARLALSAVLLGFGAREMDWHRPGGMSVLKVHYYTQGPAPLLTKLIALLLVALVAGSLVYLLVSLLPKWRVAWAEREPVAITALCFLGSLVVAKLTDRSLNAIREVTGWMAPDWLYALQQAIEEPLELLLPWLIAIAVLQSGVRAVGAELAAPVRHQAPGRSTG